MGKDGWYDFGLNVIDLIGMVSSAPTTIPMAPFKLELE